MKTVFDKETRDALILRIENLDENAKALWGIMTICQMLKHCALFDGMILGRMRYKRLFFGRLFGKIALKEMLRDDQPIRQNLTTLPELKVRESLSDFKSEKIKWIGNMEAYNFFLDTYTEHAFFGKITTQQAGLLSYKHADHHLRQFNG